MYNYASKEIKMNVQELQEIFKEQIDEGLSVAPFLYVNQFKALDDFYPEEDIVDMDVHVRSVDSMTDEGKENCYICKLYADFDDLDDIANIVLYDAKYVKMYNNIPVFTHA